MKILFTFLVFNTIINYASLKRYTIAIDQRIKLLKHQLKAELKTRGDSLKHQGASDLSSTDDEYNSDTEPDDVKETDDSYEEKMAKKTPITPLIRKKTRFIHSTTNKLLNKYEAIPEFLQGMTKERPPSTHKKTTKKRIIKVQSTVKTGDLTIDLTTPLIPSQPTQEKQERKPKNKVDKIQNVNETIENNSEKHENIVTEHKNVELTAESQNKNTEDQNDNIGRQGEIKHFAIPQLNFALDNFDFKMNFVNEKSDYRKSHMNDVFFRRQFTEQDKETPLEWAHCQDVITPFFNGMKKNISNPKDIAVTDHVVTRFFHLLQLNTSEYSTQEDVISVLEQISNLQLRFFQWSRGAMNALFDIIIPGKAHTIKNLKIGVKSIFRKWNLDISNTTSLLLQSRVFRPPCFRKQGTASTKSHRGKNYKHFKSTPSATTRKTICRGTNCYDYM